MAAIFMQAQFTFPGASLAHRLFLLSLPVPRLPPLNQAVEPLAVLQAALRKLPALGHKLFETISAFLVKGALPQDLLSLHYWHIHFLDAARFAPDAVVVGAMPVARLAAAAHFAAPDELKNDCAGQRLQLRLNKFKLNKFKPNQR